MDTSEQYIKMCEKATEIQEQKPLDYDGNLRDGEYFSGDYITHCDDMTITEFVGKASYCEDCWYNQKPTDDYTWLPRQDQLQAMVVNPHVIGRLYDFADFVHKEPYMPNGIIGKFKMFKEPNDEACHFFNSMEQLWLAFVMKEKYNKEWNGEEWVNAIH